MPKGLVGINRAGLKNAYKNSSKEVQNYFDALGKLLEHEEFDYSISVAYLFFRIEYAHTLALYYRLLQLKVDKELANKAVNETHIEHKDFLRFFKKVFGEDLNKKAAKELEKARSIRNKIMHGKDNFVDKEMREAIPSLLKYAELFNKQVADKVGFKPFFYRGES